MTTHLKSYFTHRSSWALGAIFASVGTLFGNWVTWIPHIKQKFELNDGQLGLLLLSLPIAATLTNPFTTLIIGRYGMRVTTLFGITGMALAFILPVNVPYLWLVALSLGLMGACISITNVGMNTCVTAIEQQENRRIMSTSHGMFSGGGMVGAALASFMMGLKVPILLHIGTIALGILGLVLIVRPSIMLIPEEFSSNKQQAKFAWPNRVLVGMIVVSICTNVTEGTMSDWTAVYLREVVQANDFFIGWGFAAYAFFMAMGRFIGDSLIPTYGTRKILVMGGLIAAAGILLAVLIPFTLSAIIGFGLVGAGVSCGAPILYGSAARTPGMAQGAGLATMNTFSLIGFMAGPALIGLLSTTYSLSLAIGLVAFLALFWAFLSHRIPIY